MRRRRELLLLLLPRLRGCLPRPANLRRVLLGRRRRRGGHWRGHGFHVAVSGKDPIRDVVVLEHICVGRSARSCVRENP
jgi:hypothetical protein